MSLESALDEERREVLALLEGRPSVKRQGESPARAQSPAAAQSPVRSMLDIGNSPPMATRHTSIAMPIVGGGSPTSTTTPSVRSMLNTTSPPISPRSPYRSGNSQSPAPRNRLVSLGSLNLNPEEQYQFEMLPSIDAHALPKRVTQGGKKQQRAMSGVYGGAQDLLVGKGGVKDRGRHNSTSGGMLSMHHKSKSPSSRLGRSNSPGLNKNNLNLMSDPNKFTTESGKVIDMHNAYRKLSDAALVRSGGALASLPSRKGSDPTKGESVAPDGGVRLEKDYYADEDDEDAIESSDDNDSLSSDEEGWGSRPRRGRRRHRHKNDDKQTQQEARTAKSLLAAAEDESEFGHSKICIEIQRQELFRPIRCEANED
jgi:hypothetical protein